MYYVFDSFAILRKIKKSLLLWPNFEKAVDVDFNLTHFNWRSYLKLFNKIAYFEECVFHYRNVLRYKKGSRPIHEN